MMFGGYSGFNGDYSWGGSSFGGGISPEEEQRRREEEERQRFLELLAAYAGGDWGTPGGGIDLPPMDWENPYGPAESDPHEDLGYPKGTPRRDSHWRLDPESNYKPPDAWLMYMRPRQPNRWHDYYRRNTDGKKMYGRNPCDTRGMPEQMARRVREACARGLF